MSGSFDDTARVWDPTSGTSFSLRGHAAPVDQALFDKRGTRVATVHQDHKVKIWNTVPFQRPRCRRPTMSERTTRSSTPSVIGR